MSCPPMDAVEKKSNGTKPSQSWMAMRLYYPSSSSGKNRDQPAMAAEGRNGDNQNNSGGGGRKKKKRSVSISRSMSMACAAGSICSTKESSVMSRRNGGSGGAAAARSASSRSLKAPDDAAAISATSSFNSEATAATTTTVTTTTSSSSPPSSSALSSPLSSSFGGSSFRGVVQIRKLSGCYECHSVFDPTRSLAGAAAFPCTDCDEVFIKAESLELHRATRHAVSELAPDDTSRNIVEIIFQSSWLRKPPAPACKIERILKVQNSDRTVKRFEQYKESIKERAGSNSNENDELGKKTTNARCVADGNELLRFHCTTFTCALGAGGGTALCRAPSSTQCKLCAIIRDGFRVDGDEGKIATMATSGRAHDTAAQELSSSDGEERRKAMLVCRVVAGRMKKKKGTDTTKSSENDDTDYYDSVSVSRPCSSEGVVYSDLDELFVFNARAILPCFVVIYSGY